MAHIPMYVPPLRLHRREPDFPLTLFGLLGLIVLIMGYVLKMDTFYVVAAVLVVTMILLYFTPNRPNVSDVKST